MRKNVVSLLVMAGIIVSFAVHDACAGIPFFTKKKSTAPATVKSSQAAGNITELNIKRSTFMLFADRGWIAIVVDKNTTLVKGRKNIKFADMKNGDFATVTYEIVNKINIAKSIIVGKGKSAPAKKK